MSKNLAGRTESAPAEFAVVPSVDATVEPIVEIVEEVPIPEPPQEPETDEERIEILEQTLPPPLDSYAKNLVEDGGLWELDDLLLVDETMLPALGITKPFHQKRMLKFVREYSERKAAAAIAAAIAEDRSGSPARIEDSGRLEGREERSGSRKGGEESGMVGRSATEPAPTIPRVDLRSRSGSGSVGHVMISYSWDNQPTILRIRDCLRAAGISVWLDLDHMRGDLVEAMAAAVEESEIVLVCFSSSYAQSTNCTKELRFAMHRKKRIIPLKMQAGYELTSGGLAFALAGLLYYDFTSEEKFTSSVKSLVRAIAEHYSAAGVEGDADAVVEAAASAAPAPSAPAISDSAIEAASAESRRRYVEGLKVGDRVRVKADVVSPKYSWGSARPGDVGTVSQEADEEGKMKIDFPAHVGWIGAAEDLEHAPGGGFEVGDIVRIKPNVRDPKLGWGSSKRFMVGRVSEVVNFRLLKLVFEDGPEDFSAAPGDLELVEVGEFRIGDGVRVAVDEPRLGWGGTRRGEVGRLVRFLSRDRCHVNFASCPGWLGWTGFLSDLGKVEGGGYNPGDVVFVPPWQKPPPGREVGEVGNVVAADSMSEIVVHFPDSDGAPAVLHPRQVAYFSTPFGISLGDHVTRNPGMEAKYGDGGVEVGSNGEVVFIEAPWKCFVNFAASHSYWHSGVEDLVKLPFGGFEVGMHVSFREWLRKPRVEDFPPGVNKFSSGVLVGVEETDDDIVRVEFATTLPRIGITDSAVAGGGGGGSGVERKRVTMRCYVGDLAFAGTGDISVGAKVRVRSDLVGTPRYGWGSVSPGECGIITKALNEDMVMVDFESHQDWRGHPDDLELAPE